MRCSCCKQDFRFVFPVLSRENGFVDSYETLCNECAELVNDEYYCGSFRTLVPLDVLPVGHTDDFGVSGLLVA